MMPSRRDRTTQRTLELIDRAQQLTNRLGGLLAEINILLTPDTEDNEDEPPPS